MKTAKAMRDIIAEDARERREQHLRQTRPEMFRKPATAIRGRDITQDFLDDAIYRFQAAGGIIHKSPPEEPYHTAGTVREKQGGAPKVFY